jgi:2-heptyl-3-hydroxy-4(1H)-quinolone synthase
LIYDDLYDLNIKSWYKGNIVLIGDAAHAITPNLGSGAAMAMEDALCLANSIKNNESSKSAFEHYYRERQKRVRYIRGASYWLGKGAQLEGVLGMSRNIFVKLTGRISTPYTIKKVIGLN